MHSAAPAKRKTIAGTTTDTTLDLTPIRLIHRHQDGVITFHRKRKDKFHNVVGIRSSALERSFPKHAKKLRRDAYFSLNAYWHGAADADEVPAGRARQPCRLRYLCTCFCDLDCYNAKITPRRALARIKDLERLSVIPTVSGFAFSGRGLWIFWLIQDRDDARRAQRAFPEKIRLYQEIQTVLHDRLATLGAEAKDACRVARVPGSVNSKSGTAVEYKFQLRPDGQPITHTLAALADHLGIDQTKPRQHSSTVKPGRVPNRRRGWLALQSRRLREFERLRELRGGFRNGCRNHAAMIYACLLRWNGYTQSVAKEKIFQMGRECHPRLSRGECNGALETGFDPKMQKFKDQTIANLLNITPGESELLEKLPPASRFHRPQPPPPTPRRNKMPGEKRRNLITALIKDLGYIPSTREMAGLLSQHGCHVSHVSIAADYKKLHHPMSRCNSTAEAEAAGPASPSIYSTS